MLDQLVSTKIAISMETRGDDAEVRVQGEIDVETSHDLVDALHQLRHAGITHIKIDVADVTFMDSAGVRGLIRLATERPHVTIVIARPTPMVRRLLAVTRLDDHLQVI